MLKKKCTQKEIIYFEESGVHCLLLAAATGQVYTKKKEMETEGNDAPAPKQSSFDCLWCVTVEQRQVDVPFFGLNQVNFFHVL
jgi:hypothetical protein